MNITTIVTIIAIIGLVIGVAVLAYLYVKNTSLEQIRADVYQLFLVAEHEFQYGENEQKFEYVVQLARSLLPEWVSTFITEKNLRKVVQLWFTAVKDLLDDGKYNKSTEQIEE